MIITNAIYEYKLDTILHSESILVNYDDMEPYESTIKRFWDFGYKRILPKEKFKIIKPYNE